MPPSGMYKDELDSDACLVLQAPFKCLPKVVDRRDLFLGMFNKVSDCWRGESVECKKQNKSYTKRFASTDFVLFVNVPKRSVRLCSGGAGYSTRLVSSGWSVKLMS
ncbi:hypothetical protein PoB_003013300 [Plakobranchus ocellatus]|uniref:Uncharacterized protein n=1 Tax=Plakobranchus ocellatus TaxID=259542 RepID=A0AAV4AAF5_9GAST|nr:hypothetical protein PoB_003013300 [Plakobranchus ocellatus]